MKKPKMNQDVELKGFTQERKRQRHGTLRIRVSLTSTLQKMTMPDPAGTLKKGLERNLLNPEHERPLPLLDLTPGVVQVCPSNLNETRIPSRWKCSRRICPMQL